MVLDERSVLYLLYQFPFHLRQLNWHHFFFQRENGFGGKIHRQSGFLFYLFLHQIIFFMLLMFQLNLRTISSTNHFSLISHAPIKSQGKKSWEICFLCLFVCLFWGEGEGYFIHSQDIIIAKENFNLGNGQFFLPLNKLSTQFLSPFIR